MGYKDAYRDWLSWCDDAEKKELLLLKDEKELNEIKEKIRKIKIEFE